jgi:hypothetical protein
MKTSTMQRRKDEQQNLFGTTAVVIPEGNACHIISVGKRRDGGTRYWCLRHRADATAKYGKPASACRTAHFPPIAERDILTLDFAKYPGGVALPDETRDRRLREIAPCRVRCRVDPFPSHPAAWEAPRCTTPISPSSGG